MPIKNIFSRHMPKSKAIAFVDFEHWYISLDRRYHIRPDITGWFEEVSKRYDLRDIYFFADFSNQSLRAEIPRIRQITSSIIETQNATNHITKDFTDFIILDHIYQQAMSKDEIKAYIILTGDGHFSSAAAFLKNRCRKIVEIYGVKGAISQQLRSTASRCTELPFEGVKERENQKYLDMILEHLKFIKDNNIGKLQHNTTFKDTVDAVAEYNSADKGEISDALKYLIDNGYITQGESVSESGQSSVTLDVNWDLLTREGVYTPPADKQPEKKTEEPQKGRPAPETKKNNPEQKKPMTAPDGKPGKGQAGKNNSQQAKKTAQNEQKNKPVQPESKKKPAQVKPVKQKEPVKNDNAEKAVKENNQTKSAKKHKRRRKPASPQNEKKTTE